MLNKKESKGGDLDGDDDDFPISPRTDENYRKIDAEFAQVMHEGGIKVIVSLKNLFAISGQNNPRTNVLSKRQYQASLRELQRYLMRYNNSCHAHSNQ